MRPRLSVTVVEHRRIVVRVQGGICASCGGRMHSRQKSERATLDHVWPRHLGGADHPGNLIAVHFRCNQAKKARPPTGCEQIWLYAVTAGILDHYGEVPYYVVSGPSAWALGHPPARRTHGHSSTEPRPSERTRRT